MSFVDYGFDIFSFGSQREQSGFQSCGDCVSSSGPIAGANFPFENSCYHVVVNHLIDLGTFTENELALAKRELAKYKRLELTPEQVEQLREFDKQVPIKSRFSNYKKLDSDISNDDFNDSRIFDYTTESNIRRLPGITLLDKKNKYENECCCVKNVSSIQAEINCAGCNEESSSVGNAIHEYENGIPLSQETYHAAITKKDSEISSLKNDNASKEAEAKELEEEKRKLEIVIEKMKNDIELLEDSSKISQSQIENIILQKNEELEISRKNNEKLERELKDERRDKILHAREVEKLQVAIREIQAINKKITEELKMTKRRTEALEASNGSQAVLLKQKQQECDNLDKLNIAQENEIEKLLNIVKNLNEKYERTKIDLAISRDDLESRDKKLTECRAQLETVDYEVSKLIAGLSESLGPLGRSESLELTSLKESQRKNSYAQARELIRCLNKVVKEHEKCQTHRVDLMREIDRLGAINKTIVQPMCGMEKVKDDANQDIARLKKIVLDSNNYQAVKAEIKSIIDELLARVDNRTIEKIEKAYLDVANEASIALHKLDEKINDRDAYRKYEDVLLFELEYLQEALDDVEKIFNDADFDENKSDKNYLSIKYEEKRRKFYGDNSSIIIESTVSKKILESVQNSTKIVIRIFVTLSNDNPLKIRKYEQLQNQLQQTLTALNDIGNEKCDLQNKYKDSLNKSNELSMEVDKLRILLNEKSIEFQSFNTKMQTRFDAEMKENEALRKNLTVAERMLQDSRVENAALINKSDEIINSLHREVTNKELKLKERDKLINFLNTKLEESTKVIEQLQNTLVEEKLQTIECDSFATFNNRISELVKEKDKLIEKISILESKLSNYERNNNKMENNLARILEDNEYLERCINNFKNENCRLETNIANKHLNETNLAVKCDNVLEKIENITKYPQHHLGNANVNESIIQSFEKEIKHHKEKLNQLEKELHAKEKEIIDKNKKIESLINQVNKAKEENTTNSSVLIKQIETLTREKSELKNELKQTFAQYEDKLAEMHKQYRHNEIELHKNHNDSIRRLEAQYMEMLREEGKIFSSQNWLQSLNAGELQELHDKICKTPLCSNNTNDKDVFEEQKKRNINKNILPNSAVRKSILAKKDPKGNKSSSAGSVKPNSRQRLSARESISTHSIVLPEKDYPHRLSNNLRSDTPGNRNRH